MKNKEKVCLSCRSTNTFFYRGEGKYYVYCNDCKTNAVYIKELHTCTTTSM